MSLVSRTQLIEKGSIVDSQILSTLIGSVVQESVRGTIYDGIITFAKIVMGPDGPVGITYTVEYEDFL